MSRIRVLALAGGITAAALVLALTRSGRNTEAPSPSGPRHTPAGPSTPNSGRLPSSGRRPSAAAVQAEGNLDLHRTTARRLRAGFEEAFRRDGARGAHAFILEELSRTPADLEGRVRRSGALRFLPYLARKDPTLRPLVEEELERRSGSDTDPFGRYVALAVRLDLPLFFSREGNGGFWFASSGPLPPQAEDPEESALGTGLREDARLRGQVRDLFAAEGDAQVRWLQIVALGTQPGPADGTFLAHAALRDSEPGVRYEAIDALGRLPATPETFEALEQAAMADVSAENRDAAARRLVELGATDDRWTLRLLDRREKTEELFRLLGRTYARGRSPRVEAFLREQLGSPDPVLRARAASGIQASGDRAFLPHLAAALEGERDAAVRTRLSEAAATLRAAPER